MADEVLVWGAGWMKVLFSDMEDTVGGLCLVDVVGRIMYPPPREVHVSMLILY